jgi:hypothetical protein
MALAHHITHVEVVDDGSQQPLPNAELIDLGSGAHRFTNDGGEAALPWPGDGRLRLRVRQLGFQFVDRTLVRDANASPASDTITVALRRVAYALPQVFSNTRYGSNTPTTLAAPMIGTDTAWNNDVSVGFP